MMRKLTALLISCVCVLTAQAQMTVTSRFDLGDSYYAALSIPQEFSYDNSPKLTMYNNNNSAEANLLVYDENLNLEKTIALKNDLTFDYQFTYKREKREVKEVHETNRVQIMAYPSYQDFIDQNMMTNPNFSENWLTITVQDNGDSLITIDKYSSNMRKYPLIYWICSQGKVYGYRSQYAVTYTDWHTVDTYTTAYQKQLKRIKLCNINLNQGDGKANYYFIASQTLFNNDAEYEYIVPKYKVSATEKNAYYDANTSISISTSTGLYTRYEPLDTVRTDLIDENRYVVLAGFQVVTADGTVVKDLDFDDDFEGDIEFDYAHVITIGKNTYLAFRGRANDGEATVFYKIDRTTSDIRQVRQAAASMLLSPVVAERNATVDISLKDDNKDGSDITVVSANGIQVDRVSIPANQTSSQFSVKASAGVYCVNRIRKGKVVETKKIVIK